jgi:uncharacterized lipoprotein YddW (UPF0748 family)
MNRSIPARVLFGALAATLLLAGAATAQDPELRGMWVSRFEWPHANPATCKANITSIMQNLANANFNAVFFQVRGQADVFYPSPYEGWSPLLGETDPGWDPLAYAIEAAHDRGLEFHAYMNTHTCWQSNPAGARTLPENPNHILYAHCKADDPAHRDWLHHNDPVAPVQFSESEYAWFAPGVPAFQAYIRQQYVFVAQNYAVDGIHYDRIRTPWSNQPSYDPISLARFNDPQTNPNNLNFTAWTADQITRTVRDIYAAVMAVNPNVKISAAVYSNPGSAPTAEHQEALRWAQNGAIDILVPMMYFAGGAGSTWDLRLQAWLSGSAGRHVVAGHSTSQGNSSLLEQVALTRQRGAEGNSIFSISSFSGWSNYASGVYAQPAPTPEMPWKQAPTHAIIHGYITDATGALVVDAQVVRTGSSYIGLSSGDGFYSFLQVPGGTYTLTVSDPAYVTVQDTITVAAGEIVRHDLQFGMPIPPVLAAVTPDPEEVFIGEGYTRTLVLEQGRATSWELLEGPPGAQVAGGVVSGWTPQPEDMGQTIAFEVRASNPAGSDEVRWNVFVARPPRCESLLLADFDGYDPGTRVLFREPLFSGSTSDDLAGSPNVAEVTDATSFSDPHSYLVQWQFRDTEPLRWVRLTTNNAQNKPNPTIPLDRPIRVRLRLDSGTLRVAVGVRETGTTAAPGEDGGTGGTIEWIGAASDVGGAPQGRLLEGRPGEWQSLVFDPLTDPIHGMTGNGTLYSITGLGVFEHLAFSIVDGAGPYTVYIDDVSVICPPAGWGDLDGDGDADLVDFASFAGCLQGPGVPVDQACSPADADGDGDVDLHDARKLQDAYTGAY